MTPCWKSAAKLLQEADTWRLPPKVLHVFFIKTQISPVSTDRKPESQPLYSRLRQNYLHNCFSLLENDLITQLRAIEISLLKGQQLNMAVITSLVNFIRNNPDDFPEWQESDTARRYEQTSFQNKKHAAGYWW